MATTARRSGILCRPGQLRKGAVAELRRAVYTAGIRRAGWTIATVTARMTTSVSVGVLGAAGTIAPAIVHDLAVSEEVERMLLLDLDGARAATVAEQHGGGKADEPRRRRA